MKVTSQGNPKLFAILGLVIGILSLLFSLIPCIGYYAMIPSIMALLLSGVGFYLQKKENGRQSLPISGIIISAIALTASIYQYYQFKIVFDAKDKIENIEETLKDEIVDEVKDRVIDEAKDQIHNYLEKDSIQDAKKHAHKKK